VPYTVCRMEAQECVRRVPCTECHLEPYCETYKVCRCVPVCVPCEPCCVPECCPCSKSCKPMHHWLARYHGCG